MNGDLQGLGRRLVGRWATEATHPGLPGAVVRGSSEIEWFEGERFLIYRSRYDHPDIPDSISIIGDTDGLSYALLRLARRPQDPRRDRDRRGVGDGNGPTLIGRLVRIARCAVLAAHDLHLRGQGPDDVREGEAIV